MVRLQNHLSDGARTLVESLVDHSADFAEHARDEWNLKGDKVDVDVVAQRVSKQLWEEGAASASSSKFERELDEKYGTLKPLILHPTVQWLIAVVSQFYENFHLFGKRPLPLTASIMVGVMMVRSKQINLSHLVIAACFLLALHPLVVVIGGLLCIAVLHWPYKPRQYVRREQREPLVGGREGRGLATLADIYSSDLIGEPGDYDVVVLGSNIAGLYTAAVLAKAGKRVLVLETYKRVGGTAVAPVGDYEFEITSPAVGQLDSFAYLLAAGAHPSVPPLQWVPIGFADGNKSDVHAITQIGGPHGPMVMHPAGREAFTKYLVTQHTSEDRKLIEGFLGHMDAFQKGIATLHMCRIFPAALANRIAKIRGWQAFSAARAYCGLYFRRLIENESLLASLCTLFRAENLHIDEVSLGSFAAQAAHELEGRFYPRGGWAAVAGTLVPTIEAAGGRVLIDAPVRHVLLEDGKAVGVALGGGSVVRLSPGGAVVSCLGAVSTFRNALAPADLAAHGWPENFDILRLSRPQLHVCIGIKGNWGDDLEVTSSEYFQVRDPNKPGPTAAADGVPSRPAPYNPRDWPEWFRIRFPTAQDPDQWWSEHTTCIITAEVPAEQLLQVEPEKGGPRGYTINMTQLGPAVERLKKRLFEAYPHIKPGDCEVIEPAVDATPGLAHTPEKFVVEGLRAPTHIPGLFLAGNDLVALNGLGGSVLGGSVAAHAVLGYTAIDMLVLGRNLVSDLKNVR